MNLHDGHCHCMYIYLHVMHGTCIQDVDVVVHVHVPGVGIEGKVG